MKDFISHWAIKYVHIILLFNIYKGGEVINNPPKQLRVGNRLVSNWFMKKHICKWFWILGILDWIIYVLEIADWTMYWIIGLSIVDYGRRLCIGYGLDHGLDYALGIMDWIVCCICFMHARWLLLLPFPLSISFHFISCHFWGFLWDRTIFKNYSKKVGPLYLLSLYQSLLAPFPELVLLNWSIWGGFLAHWAVISRWVKENNSPTP